MSSVAIIFGGPSAEHDVSVLTGLQALHELDGEGIGVIGLYWDRSGNWFDVPVDAEGKDFLAGAPKGSQVVELVVGEQGGFRAPGKFGRSQKLEILAALICCHGAPGEDGTLQAMLDLAGIPYSGPTVAGASLGMDKFAFGAVCMNIGLPTLPRDLLRDDRTPSFAGPYIVKPRFGGSSIGIEIASDYETAIALLNASPSLQRGGVIEPYRPELIDLNIAVRTYPTLEMSAIERPLRQEGEFLTYRDKYVGGEGFSSAPRELPANIPLEVAQVMKAASRRIVSAAGVRGLARIDFLWHEDAIYVNEINTIPGSLSKYLWIDPPVSFSALLADLIDEAMKVPSHFYTTTGADGAALRSAGSIATKLD